MARFTITLQTVIDNTDIWNFPYSLPEEHKKVFQERFEDYYFMHEIGFETPALFKRMLKSRIQLISDRYTKLYASTLQEIDMVNNYDMTETHERVLTGERVANGKMVNDATVDGKNTSVYLDTPQGRMSINEGYATNITEDTTTNKNKTNLTNDNIENMDQKETTTLKRKGNIGVTTASDMVQKYRDILVDCDRLMIEECKDLFMGIY